MATPSPLRPGVACWAELEVTDPGATASFYGAVLGWTFTAPDPHHRVVALVRGRPVAALVPGGDGATGWVPYFAVDDAVEAADAVEELGGLLLHGPDDLGAVGRVFVAVDTGGAAFGGWELEAPDADLGAGAGITPPALPWVEALSAEPGASRTFYGRLFGWQHEPREDHGPAYSVIRDPGGPAPLGAIDFAGDALPAWLVHVGVDDVEAAVAAAEGAGGSVVATVGPDVRGRRAVLADPAGVRFAVLQED